MNLVTRSTFDSFYRAVRLRTIVGRAERFLDFHNRLQFEQPLPGQMALVKNVAIRYKNPYMKHLPADVQRGIRCRALMLLRARFPAASIFLAAHVNEADGVEAITLELAGLLYGMVVLGPEGPMLRQLQAAMVELEQVAIQRWPNYAVVDVIAAKALARSIWNMRFGVLGYVVERPVKRSRWRLFLSIRQGLLTVSQIRIPLPHWERYWQ